MNTPGEVIDFVRNLKKAKTAATTIVALGVTTNLTAVPGTFVDLPAVQTYLVTLQADTEARLDDIEGKLDTLIADLKASGSIKV